ncbi:hypothetical protein Hanom_Chr09g00815701 [Helianthus anomalus]
MYYYKLYPVMLLVLLSFGVVDKEDSLFLELYWKNASQVATSVAHIKEGLRVRLEMRKFCWCLVVGETRKDAGPRNQPQSYWMVAESKRWFGEFL